MNATDPTPAGSGQYIRRWFRFTTLGGNTPPVFFAPSPANGSAGNPQSLTWSISINDTEGDLFSWTIECSNGQTNRGTDATNGTESLDLSGLANATTYTVWVNATDPTGSSLYRRQWYTFKVGAEWITVDIKGGVGVKAVIRNSGNAVITDLVWSIDVSGGILLLSGSHTGGVIDEVAGDGSVKIRSSRLQGFGHVTIVVHVADVSKQASGLLLGPLVLRVTKL